MAACSMGYRVIMTEETDWIGGQLTSQIVPPDEHPWIEQFGCTARYRRYRDLVRDYYRQNLPLTAAARENRELNPGTGWVSRLCHEPRIGWAVLNAMLQPHLTSGLLQIMLHTVPTGADGEGDHVRSVSLQNTHSGEESVVHASYFLDATELGDLLPLTGTEYVIGAESKRDTQEPNAVDGDPEPDNVQGITWCFAGGFDPGGDHTIDKPKQYAKWRAYKPDFWPGPHLGFQVLHAHTGKEVTLPLFGKDADDWYALFPYRQIVEPKQFDPGAVPHAATVVNWPQNDYFEGTIIDVPRETFDARLNDAKQLSLSLLYWLQTEAPRHDGGVGYPELYLRPDITGTDDGFAMAPYIRESRRIRAQFTVLEQHVSADANPGRDRAVEFADSVGVGSYRIDLHPSTNGCNTIDTSTLPFQIPLGSLLPIRTRNLLPACKNLGVTHITNGCYRLHPVEWNIGESAGLLAAHCLRKGLEPHHVGEDDIKTKEFQALMRAQGIELEWPRLRTL
jgi:hypothetical protein